MLWLLGFLDKERTMENFEEMSKDELLTTDGGLILEVAVSVYVGVKVYQHFEGIYQRAYEEEYSKYH